MNIREMQQAAWQVAEDHGFHKKASETGERLVDVPERLVLIHSEVSEALECYRDGDMISEISHLNYGAEGKPVGFPTELADIVIRVFDLAQDLGIDLQAEIERKHEYNKGRPYRHGRKVL